MKKGFTLVELLVVIVILGLIALVVYPAILGVINNSKQKASENQEKIIENAAKKWGLENSSKLPDKDKVCKVELKDLTKYIGNDDFIDPKTNKGIEGCVKVSLAAENEGNQYQYHYEDKDNCNNIENEC